MAVRKLFAGVLRLAIPAFGSGQLKNAGYNNSGVRQAYEHWSQARESSIAVMFLDVRSPEEFAEARIAGAKLIPIQVLSSYLHEIPKDVRIYVYCHSGWRSARASDALARAGFANVENILGGIQAWQRAGYPVELPESNPID